MKMRFAILIPKFLWCIADTSRSIVMQKFFNSVTIKGVRQGCPKSGKKSKLENYGLKFIQWIDKMSTSNWL